MSTYKSGGPGHVWLDNLYQKKEIWRDLYWFLGLFRDDKNVTGTHLGIRLQN